MTDPMTDTHTRWVVLVTRTSGTHQVYRDSGFDRFDRPTADLLAAHLRGRGFAVAAVVALEDVPAGAVTRRGRGSDRPWVR